MVPVRQQLEAVSLAEMLIAESCYPRNPDTCLTWRRSGIYSDCQFPSAPIFVTDVLYRRGGWQEQEDRAMRTRGLFVLAFATLLILPATAQEKTTSGQSEYILTTNPSSIDSLNLRHGLSYKATVWQNPRYGYALYLVTAPSSKDPSSLRAELNSDPA